MNRRETIKSLLASSVISSFLISGCDTKTSQDVDNTILSKKNPKGYNGNYGRTESEKSRDKRVLQGEYLTSHEIETIAHLSDIILPANDKFGSATSVGVVSFIDFIVKDIHSHQRPIRGGIMWIDTEMNKRHNKDFIDCTQMQQLNLCDQIAFPGKTPKELFNGESFFSLVRNLVLTGYYTSQEGFEDLGYKGNSPNVWDGVPQEVLNTHGLDYEKEWLKKCVDQSKRDITAQWDNQGNLIS